MKSIILSIFLVLNVIVYAQAHNPPDKICFDYDIAGNRIAQKPAWLITLPDVYNPDCLCNVPENTKSNFNQILIRVTDISHLEILTGILTNVSWVLPIRDVPIGILSSGPVFTYTPSSPVLSPNEPTGILLDFGGLEPRSMEVKKQDTIKLDVSIIPNPNEGQFQVIQKGFDRETSEIIIIDAKGGIVFRREYVEGYVNISEYASGTYILILKDSNNNKSVRFVKK